MKTSLIFTLLLLSPLIAETSFEQWRTQETQAFASYQTQMDRDFVEMLKRDWQAYQAREWYSPYRQPKPHQQPRLSVIPEIKELIKITPRPLNPVTPSNPPEMSIPDGYNKIDFDFFAIGVEISYDQRLSPSIGSLSSSAIAHHWEMLSLVDYQPLIQQIEVYQTQYQFNDWATYLLVREIAQQISHESRSQTLLRWFLLVKLGMDAKVGFSTEGISLLVHSQEQIYGVKYFGINGKKYYNFDAKKSQKLQIYSSDIASLAGMKFRGQGVRLPRDIKSRSLRFSYHNKAYQLRLRYNQNLVDLYQTYPQLEYRQYHQISSLARDTLHQVLSPILSQMDEVEAINFLLRLTQNGFSYRTDEENFGHEKVMFFEETLYHEYSDCEDRAIFFAQLVQTLLGKKLLYIKYPNHLATAILLSNSTQGGDSFIYNNQRYTIADPTYSSANIGQAMPELKGIKFKIIEP